jgi:FkbM family methyltransferase
LQHGPAAGLKSCECLPFRRGSAPPDNEEDRFLNSLSLEGQVVYDIGAHIGIFSLAFARKVGPRGCVVAFEPYPPNYRRLLRNVKLNHATTIIPVNAAVGAEAGELVMASRTGEPGRVTVSSDATKIGMKPIGTTKTVNLDSLLKEETWPLPDFMKIDVEGFEWQVLQGARELLRRHHPQLFIELHGAGYENKRTNARRVVAFLEDLGYELDHVESGARVTSGNDGGVFEGHLAAHVPVPSTSLPPDRVAAGRHQNRRFVSTPGARP